MITKIITYYAVGLGIARALRKIRQDMRPSSPYIIGNELRSLTIWYRDGTVHHEETP